MKSGKVASVGLDVYEAEPQIHEGLANDERVLLLPHMGTWTYETQDEMEKWTMGNVRCALEWMRVKGEGDERRAGSDRLAGGDDEELS